MPADIPPRQYVTAHLLIYQVLAAVVTLLVAVLHPYGRPVDEMSQLHIAPLYGWLFFQSWVLCAPGTLVGVTVAVLHPRSGAFVGGLLISCVPLLVLGDILTFNWIGERLLSKTTLHILTALLPGLLQYATGGLILAGSLIVLTAFILLLLAWSLAARIARSLEPLESGMHRAAAVVVAALILLGLLAIPASRWSRTLAEMHEYSDRHPLCAALVVGYRGTGVAPPQGDDLIHSKLTALCFAESVYEQSRRFDEIHATGKATNRRNVLVVVVESWRHEMVDPQIMPNVYDFSQDAMWCRMHFSAGNSTSTSMFSMFNGLESIWFERLRERSPLLPRLFSQAGYETAFFGGDDSWHLFHMDGFVNASWFDEFQIQPLQWLRGDRKFIEQTQRFLQGDTIDPAGTAPRLAVLYLTGTHFDYHSDPVDRVFQPAAGDGLTAPYPRSERDKVWNRYKNSMRTADKILAPLLQRDWVVVLVGDHGEAFHEDGCCSHGVRVSRYQNMTPALIYVPGSDPAEITSPTTHADLLPTLLAATGIPTSDPDLFTGIDVASPQRDDPRSFLTRNYVVDEGVLIGPWTADPSQPFGYRVFFSISQWQAAAANPVGEDGLEYAPTTDQSGFETTADDQLRQWSAERFPDSTPCWDQENIELIAQHLASPLAEVRLEALSAAMQMKSSHGDSLRRMVQQATRDPNRRVRDRAQAAFIELQRRAQD